MRIIGGKFRGKKIEAPDVITTRPTLDRVRETIFNIIEHNKAFPSLKGSMVIDVFAGSGAMGIEAYSRGADQVLFVENSHEALRVLRQNIFLFDHGGGLMVSGIDFKKLPLSNIPYDFCFMDPPYEENVIAESLEKLAKSGYLKDGSIIVAESGAKQSIKEIPGFEVIDRRIVGSVAISFIKFYPLITY